MKNTCLCIITFVKGPFLLLYYNAICMKCDQFYFQSNDLVEDQDLYN